MKYGVLAVFIFFDLDGTLITGYLDTPDKDYHRWEVLPGRRERLIELRRAGHQLGIITNQGGVGVGLVTQEDFQQKMARVHRALGGTIPYSSVAVCFSAPRDDDPRRKPSGAMIRELMVQFAYSEERARAMGTLYVGDRPEDEAAADDAGVQFMWAYQFFDS